MILVATIVTITLEFCILYPQYLLIRRFRPNEANVHLTIQVRSVILSGIHLAELSIIHIVGGPVAPSEAGVIEGIASDTVGEVGALGVERV